MIALGWTALGLAIGLALVDVARCYWPRKRTAARFYITRREPLSAEMLRKVMGDKR